MMEYSYGSVVDAGFSGSRIFVYRWPKHGDGPTEEVFHEEMTPGISDLEHGLDALQELVTLAKNALPQHHPTAQDVPIYLGATAGLRLVDPEQREETLTRIRVMLHASDFMFQDNWARVLSGEEEGIYDWITINYMKNDGALPDRLSPTFGALDLGGASTQISFRSRERRLLRRNAAFSLRIDDSKYLLYSHSFLHYGVDEARAKHSRHIAANKTQNPCYPVGYVDEETSLTGSSNWDECLRSVSQLFDPAHCLDDGDSCFDSASLTQLASNEEKFVATSAFVFAWDFLQLKTGANTDDLATLDKQAKKICNLEYSQQMSHYRQYKSRRNGSSIRTTTKPHAQCFNAAYSYHLLSKGYSMPITNTPIEVDDIKSWTLGMMLVEANNLAKDISNGELYSNLLHSYECLIAGSTLMLMLLTSFVLRRRWRKMHRLPHVVKAQAL